MPKSVEQVVGEAAKKLHAAMTQTQLTYPELGELCGFLKELRAGLIDSLRTQDTTEGEQKAWHSAFQWVELELTRLFDKIGTGELTLVPASHQGNPLLTHLDLELIASRWSSELTSRTVHRIWLGSFPPRPDGRLGLRLWHERIEEANRGRAPWTQVLWVWDTDELVVGSKSFTSQRHSIKSGGATINCCGTITCHEKVVASVAAIQENDYTLRQTFKDWPLMLKTMDQSLFKLIKVHEQGNYLLASDLLRILLVAVYGGLYMDIDILPGPGADALLKEPRTPAPCGVGGAMYSGYIENCLLLSNARSIGLLQVLYLCLDKLKQANVSSLGDLRGARKNREELVKTGVTRPGAEGTYEQRLKAANQTVERCVKQENEAVHAWGPYRVWEQYRDRLGIADVSARYPNCIVIAQRGNSWAGNDTVTDVLEYYLRNLLASTRKKLTRQRFGRAFIEYAKEYQENPFHPHRLRFGPPRSEVNAEEPLDDDTTSSIDFDELERRLAQLKQ